MQRSTHILLACLVVSVTIVDPNAAENKPSIASAEFLQVLAKNVATVLSPTLVEELQVGRPNRTAFNATQVQSIIDFETTESPSKLSNLEADTVRSAQTQSEVGTRNPGFQFNYDDNYRYNYPGINPQSLQRPDYPSGLPFGHPGYYNPDVYRSFPSQTTADRNPRPTENVLQPGEPSAGVAAVENPANGQPGRTLDSLDPTSSNFERFRNSDRFPFNNQFSSGFGNFPNFPLSPERLQDGRFHDGRYNPYNNHSPINSNLPNSPNFRNSIGNNYPRNNFQTFLDPFQQRHQSHGVNSFDFPSSQRFQDSYDNYPRSLQRGPNLPDFFRSHYGPELRDLDILTTPSSKNDVKKSERAALTGPTAETTKSNVTGEGNSSSTVERTTENPEVFTIDGQIRFGNLFSPVLDDYSDLRFHPDAFRQYLLAPGKKDDNKIPKFDNDDKKNNTNINVNETNKSTNVNVNDV